MVIKKEDIYSGDGTEAKKLVTDLNELTKSLQYSQYSISKAMLKAKKKY